MTNERIDTLINTLTAIKNFANQCEREMREDDPLADSRDALIAALEMIEDDGMLCSPHDLDRIKDLIFDA